MIDLSYFPVVVNAEYAEQVREKYSKWLMLDVGEPVTITTREHIARSTSVTTYLIRIETNHGAFREQCSAVRRRYSHFCWLRSTLAKNFPKEILPPLPPKKIFHIIQFNAAVIEERRKGLALFLQRILQKSVFLSDDSLHYFLQTELDLDEIEKKLAEQSAAKGYNTLLRQSSCSSAGSSSSGEM